MDFRERLKNIDKSDQGKLDILFDDILTEVKERIIEGDENSDRRSQELRELALKTQKNKAYAKKKFEDAIFEAVYLKRNKVD